MTRLGAIVEEAVQCIRRMQLRWLQGVAIPRTCKLGRNINVSGRVRIGPGSTVEDGVILSGNIEIGEQCFIGRFAHIHGNILLKEKCVVASFAQLSTMPNAKISVGADTYINSFNVIGSSESVSIGDRCIFAAFVRITDASHGIDDLSVATKHAEASASPVRIGNNVWLGGGVMVTMGATIGDDAVVGAQALVRDELPDRSISFGIPAKVKRLRQ